MTKVHCPNGVLYHVLNGILFVHDKNECVTNLVY